MRRKIQEKPVPGGLFQPFAAGCEVSGRNARATQKHAVSASFSPCASAMKGEPVKGAGAETGCFFRHATALFNQF
ncbi:hypothetical protein ATPR_1864 [Acetobacter tropicalis NBRC 101654]|uniref:Uncharacterized protein n=1 Tax=Acetobacter tropicalis NBRC 101654 TaxID=749388 RepID=F7VER5_9PROT|nr:hypothetical protein ATPR_1864 [Acetobacter tropicalis NBRC 101654]